MSIISIGDLVADIVTAIPTLPVHAGAHQTVHSISIEPGGAGNFLIAGARLGMQMCALGALGADEFGDIIARVFEEEGIDTRCIARAPGGTTTRVVALVDDLGAHVFLGVYGEGPDVELRPEWRQAVRTSDAVFTSGYALLERRLENVTVELMREAHRARVPVFFDPGWQMRELVASERVELFKLVDVVLVTEEELPIIAAQTTSEARAQAILAQGPNLVVEKRGPRGCVVYSNRGEVVESPGFPVNVRDTAAAGDCFDAAFIYGYLRHWLLAQIAQFANAMGAAKVQKLGSGRNVPTAAEVRVVLQRFNVMMNF